MVDEEFSDPTIVVRGHVPDQMVAYAATSS